MKEKALYHLLQLRARKFSNNLPVDTVNRLKEIQASLTIKRQAGSFILEWDVGNQHYSHSPENDPFKFYVKGDSAGSSVKRDHVLNYRALNWQSAGELWRDIFRKSGLEYDILRDDGRMSFGTLDVDSDRARILQSVFFATLISVLSLTIVEISDAILLFITILAMYCFTSNYAYVHLRQRISWIQKLIVGIGCIVPLLTGVTLDGVLLIIIGFFLLGTGEIKNHFSSYLFMLAGAVFGAGVYTLGSFAIAIAFIVSVVLFLISVIDRKRIPFISSLLFFISFCIIAITIFVLVENNIVSEHTPVFDNISQTNINTMTLIFLLLLSVSFMTWWIIGVQYYLIPWVTMLALILATLITMYNGRSDVLLMLSVFSGFIAIIFQRVLLAFICSMRKSESINLKMGKNG